jgi:regulator of protease activity HflC (stomatin/prohibitin superfamily)
VPSHHAVLEQASYGVPATFSQLLLYLGAGWLVLCFVALLLCIISSILGGLFFLAATLILGYQAWLILSARQRVLASKNVPLLWNAVRLIAWDPVEGVLILKNKTVSFCDDNLEDAAGGVRLLYSILGEEVALRAPLEVQTLAFRDENVLTREYLSVTIRGTMKWRIADLKKFYLLVSRELRSTTNHDDHESISPSARAATTGDADADPAIRQLLRAAISWMQVLVEEETRSVVSKARSGLLIADKLSQELFPHSFDRSHGEASAASGEAVPDTGGAADGLAGAIHDTIARRLEPYGIAVEDVSLQEIRLPEEVMQECVEACKSYYLPTIAKRKAAFVKENLAAQAEVIGPEAVATREVVSAAPAFTLPDFLSQFLQKRLTAAGNAPALGSDASAAVAALLVGKTPGSDPQADQPPRGDERA